MDSSRACTPRVNDEDGDDGRPVQFLHLDGHGLGINDQNVPGDPHTSNSTVRTSRLHICSSHRDLNSFFTLHIPGRSVIFLFVHWHAPGMADMFGTKPRHVFAYRRGY